MSIIRLLRLLLIFAAVGALVIPALALARSGDKPPLTQSALKRYEGEVQGALAGERAMVNFIYTNTPATHTEAHSKLIFSRQDLYDSKESINDSSFGGPSPVADLNTAYEADTKIEGEMREAMGGKNFNTPFPKALVKKIVAQLTTAIAAKKRALSHMSQMTIDTPPEPPAVGPLEACVFVVNNGNTSTENVKVVDPGGAGLNGTVMFNGQGVNQTSQIHLDSNGTAVAPFTVGVFGTATIGVTVTGATGPNQTLTSTVTLGQGNDVTTSDCTAHP